MKKRKEMDPTQREAIHQECVRLLEQVEKERGMSDIQIASALTMHSAVPDRWRTGKAVPRPRKLQALRDLASCKNEDGPLFLSTGGVFTIILKVNTFVSTPGITRELGKIEETLNQLNACRDVLLARQRLGGISEK